MFKIIILQFFLALQFPLLNDEPLEDQTHTVNQDQINDIFAIHYSCREPTAVLAHQFSLSYTKTTKIYVYNTETNQ